MGHRWQFVELLAMTYHDIVREKTVRWSLARCGLDRSDTLIHSNPSSSAKKERTFVYRAKVVSFGRNKSLVKFASQLKYACDV